MNHEYIDIKTVYMESMIIHIGKFYSPYRGGMESYVQHLAEHIPLEQKVVVSNTANCLVEEEINGVHVKRLPRLFQALSQNFVSGLRDELKQSRAQIYHLHLPNPLAVLAFLKAKPTGKLIITWHSDIIRQKLFMPFYKPFLNRILLRADRIIVTSPNYLSSSPYLKKFGDKCTVVPLCIDFDAYRPTPQTDLKVLKIREEYGEKIVLFVGRLVYYKGVDYLVEAAKKTEATVLLIGNGTMEMSLKKEAPSNVVFLNQVEDLLPYYHACDAFVLPSVARSEAFGIVQLEAIACKKPIISTVLNTGVEYVNKYGLTIEPKNVAALTDGIQFLLSNDNSDMVEKNYVWGRETFDAPLVDKQIQGLYEQLL
jgi:glycosyltransferase involved in cell wall biosynthesis